LLKPYSERNNRRGREVTQSGNKPFAQLGGLGGSFAPDLIKAFYPDRLAAHFQK